MASLFGTRALVGFFLYTRCPDRIVAAGKHPARISCRPTDLLDMMGDPISQPQSKGSYVGALEMLFMASCHECGADTEIGARFCPKCGTALVEDTFREGSRDERILQKFGPFGVSVSFTRPGLFAWAQRNATEIVVTDHRIYGRRTTLVCGRTLRLAKN
jgi:hypothetical protein